MCGQSAATIKIAMRPYKFIAGTVSTGNSCARRQEIRNETGPLRRVTGTSPSNVWAAGGENIVHWNGRNLVAMGPDLSSSLVFGTSSPGFKEPQHARIWCNYDEIWLSDTEVSILPEPSLCPAQVLGTSGRLEDVRASDRPDLNRFKDEDAEDKSSYARTGTSKFGRPGRTIYSVAVDGRAHVWANTEGWFSTVTDGIPRRSRDGSVIALTGKTWREWSWRDFSSWPYWCDTFKALHSIAFNGKTVSASSTDSGLRIFEDGGWRKVASTDYPPPNPALCTIWSAPGLPVFAGTVKGLELWSDILAAKPATRVDVPFESAPGALWASAKDDVWLSTLPCSDLAQSAHRTCPARLYHFDGHSLGEYSAAPRGCTYRAIHGAAHDDIWVVGDDGCSDHFDGKAWSSVPTGTTEDLHGVAACGRGDAWAVGDKGTILHWDGSTWHLMDSGTGQDLLGIAGCGSSAIWVVGGAGSVLRWAVHSSHVR